MVSTPAKLITVKGQPKLWEIVAVTVRCSTAKVQMLARSQKFRFEHLSCELKPRSGRPPRHRSLSC